MPSLRAALTTVALAAGTMTAVAFAAAPAAEATTVSYDGLRVTTPTSATTYNGSKATVWAHAAVASGAHRQIRAKSITAYRNGKRVAKGSSVRLAPGRYALATAVGYRRWNVVTVKKTKRTFHNGSQAEGTTCRVTQIVPSDPESGLDFGQISQAVCTNRAFPGQKVTVDGPPSDVDCSYGSGPGFEICQVGDTVDTDAVDFTSYWSTRTTSATVRKYGPWRTHVFSRKTFTVVNGGHRVLLGGDQSLTTRYFTVPSGATWHANYSYDCGDFSGNWIVELHRYGTSILDDKFLDNVIRKWDYGTYRFGGGGTFRFEVITECDWTIAVHWK